MLINIKGKTIEAAEYLSMKTYHAIEMKRGEAEPLCEKTSDHELTKEEKDQDGYLVIYQAGEDNQYISWCPLKAFYNGSIKLPLKVDPEGVDIFMGITESVFFQHDEKVVCSLRAKGIHLETGESNMVTPDGFSLSTGHEMSKKDAHRKSRKLLMDFASLLSKLINKGNNPIDLIKTHEGK